MDSCLNLIARRYRAIWVHHVHGDFSGGVRWQVVQDIARRGTRRLGAGAVAVVQLPEVLL